LPRASCFVEDLPDASGEDLKASTERLSGEEWRAVARQAAAAEATKRGRLPPDQVLVNVYELLAFPKLNHLMNTSQIGLAPMGGALHAGVEIFGREWSYGGGAGEGSGIVCEEPRSNRQHRFRETVVMGRTELSSAEVALLMGELLEQWASEDYHWLHRNCLAFANELCERLGVGRLPPWIDRLPRGAGALHLGVRGLADGVHEVAEGARNLVQAIARGPGACAPCRVRPTGRPLVPAPVDAALTPARARQSMHEEVFVHTESVWSKQQDDEEIHWSPATDRVEAKTKEVPFLVRASLQRGGA